MHARSCRRVAWLLLLGVGGCRAALGGANVGVAARPEADVIAVVVAAPRGEHAARLGAALDQRLAADPRVKRIEEEAGCPVAGASYVVGAAVEVAIDANVECVAEELSLDKNPACARWEDRTDGVAVKAHVEVTDAATCRPAGLGFDVEHFAASDDHAGVIDEALTKAVRTLDNRTLFPDQARVDRVDRQGAHLAIEPGAVARDDIFVAYRGTERVGRVIVTRVTSDDAVLEGLSGGIEPAAGDALVPAGRQSWWELAPRLTLVLGGRTRDGDAGGSLPAGGGGLQLRRSPTGHGLIAGIGGEVLEAGSGGTVALGGLEAGWRFRQGPRASVGGVGGLYAARLSHSGHLGTTWTATLGVQLLFSMRWGFIGLEVGYLREASIEWERNTEGAGELAFGGVFARLALGLSL